MAISITEDGTSVHDAFLMSQRHRQRQSRITNVAKITKSYYEDHEDVVTDRALYSKTPGKDL